MNAGLKTNCMFTADGFISSENLLNLGNEQTLASAPISNTGLVTQNASLKRRWISARRSSLLSSLQECYG